MNLAAILKTGLRALPAALKASATFTRVTQGTYDAAADTTTGDVTTSFTARGPLLPLEPDRLAGVAPAEIARFRELTLAAADCAFRPDPDGTTCVINARTWRVVSVEDLAPDGVTSALYVVRLHR